MSAASDLFETARSEHAAGRSLDARLAMAAGVASLARSAGIKPIVVGGTAVDFYAATMTPRGELAPSGTLQASQDVDVVTVGSYNDHQRLRVVLEGCGEFVLEPSAIPVQSRRKWWLRGAPLLVEVLSDDLYGDPGRVVTLEVEGTELYLWAPEDTAWQYMQNALAERRPDSWERARAIAATQDIDWDYLRTRADRFAPAVLVDALRGGDSFTAMRERVMDAGGQGHPPS